MRQTATTRSTPLTIRSSVLGLAVVTAVIIGTLVARSASSSAPSFGSGDSSGALRGALATLGSSAATERSEAPRKELPRRDPGAVPAGIVGVTEKDGVLPDGVTIVDDEYPGIAGLDAGLRKALRAAAQDAGDGIPFLVNSGWRSPAYQDQLLRQAISTYGSEGAAERWVATAATSPHVAGNAVDVGVDAAAWLSRHGARYGLCQIYRNEPWHFELRPKASTHGCPAMYADPTDDPRMQ